jgi:hypothetical protein
MRSSGLAGGAVEEVVDGGEVGVLLAAGEALNLLRPSSTLRLGLRCWACCQISGCLCQVFPLCSLKVSPAEG